MRKLITLSLLLGSGLALRCAAAGAADIAGTAPGWGNWLLGLLIDPSVALLLIMVGIYGLFFEFWSPGAILPGVIGALCLLLGLYAMHMLPLNFVGVALTLLGLGLMLLEILISAFGALAIGGIVAFGFGVTMLVDPGPGVSGVPLSLVAAVAVFSAAFFLLVARVALRSHRLPPVSGREILVGSAGEVLYDMQADGWARVQGETWAIHEVGAAPLRHGQRVRVVGRSGLVLNVVADNGVDQGEKS